MCHKIDSPNITQKVYWSIKGLVVDLIPLVVSIHGRPQAFIAAIFPQSAGNVFQIEVILMSFAGIVGTDADCLMTEITLSLCFFYN